MAERAVRVALVASEGLAVRVALVVSEDPAGPAVQESPVRELELVQVEAVLEPVPVALELEHGQVVAVLVLGRPRAQLAGVALRTKLVTAAHRPDLVRLLEAAEDSVAAVAETTREPAAVEVVIAWEVAE